jgi:hypothetical protein
MYPQQDPEQTRAIPVVTDRPQGTGFTAEERAARAARSGGSRVKNYFTTGDGKLSLDSEAGRALAPAINDGYAITSLVLALVGFGPLGLIFGLVSIHQAKVEKRRVSGMAVGGVVVAIIEGVIVAFIIALLVILSIAAANSINSYNSTYGG